MYYTREHTFRLSFNVNQADAEPIRVKLKTISQNQSQVMSNLMKDTYKASNSTMSEPRNEFSHNQTKEKRKGLPITYQSLRLKVTLVRATSTVSP